MLADIVKIHCLKHQANFPMPRTSKSVVCREGSEAHTLSNNFPAEGPWIYCCNCQTFIAWDHHRTDISLKECVFCLSSLNPRAYSCDHCAVTMVDYDDPTLRKHHGVLDWGAPQPACVGCHQFPRSTPRKHFCESLQCEVATSRIACGYCGISTPATGTAASQNTSAEFRAALSEAEAKAREAEERSRLAEEAARKEIELRKQAELKAEEIERRVAIELSQARESEQSRREIEAARLQAEAEARARVEAERLAQVAELERQEAERRKAEAEAKARDVELRAREAEEHRRQAEEAVRHEAEMRLQAEQQAREVAQSYTSKLAESQAQAEAAVKNVKKDRKAIALTAGIVVALFGALIVLIMTLITYFRS